MGSLKNKAVGGMIWKTIEQIGLQSIQFLISVVLARLLLPEHYGTIAVILVFINISNSLIQSGFNTALIQTKTLSSTDSSSVFYLMLGVSLIIYSFIFISAPFIASFFEFDDFVWALRSMSILLILGPFRSIQHAKAMREFLFRQSMICTLIGVIVQGCVGIGMAYQGYGVWSLVVSVVASQITICIMQSVLIRWRPKKIFSMQAIKKLWKFGSHLFVAELLTITYANASSFIVGRLYNRVELGFYYQGYNTPNVFMSGVIDAANSVALPIMSSQQSNIPYVKAIFRKMSALLTYVMFPLTLGLFAISYDFVAVVLTAKWLPCVPYMQLSCIMMLFYPFRMQNQAINSIGKSEISLKVNLVRSLLGIAVIIMAAQISIEVMIIGATIVEALVVIMFSAYIKQNLDFPYKEQFKDVLPNLVIAITMCTTVYLMQYLFPTPSVISLIIKVASGVVIYILLSYLTKNESFLAIIEILKENIWSKKS